MHLSNRLKAIYENLIPQKDVWDICCDHGLLGIAAYRSDNFLDVYFVDQVESIMNSLRDKFYQHGYNESLTKKAHFICASGENIQTKVSGTACISGVGALSILQILTPLEKKNALTADRLILGPHNDEEAFLESIQNSEIFKNYKLISQIEVEEKQRLRQIFVLDRLV